MKTYILHLPLTYGSCNGLKATFILLLLVQILLTGCDKEDIRPASETGNALRMQHVTEENPGGEAGNQYTTNHTMQVTASWPGCTQSLYGEWLYVHNSNGIYLEPYEGPGELTLVRDAQYEVTFRYMPHDNRFDYPPGTVVCLGVPGDLEEARPIQILSLRILTRSR